MFFGVPASGVAFFPKRLRVQEVDEHQAPLGDLQRVRHLAGLRSCQKLFQLIAWSHPMPSFIELDDGKILTGKPNQFDGKNM